MKNEEIQRRLEREKDERRLLSERAARLGRQVNRMITPVRS